MDRNLHSLLRQFIREEVRRQMAPALELLELLESGLKAAAEEVAPGHTGPVFKKGEAIDPAIIAAMVRRIPERQRREKRTREEREDRAAPNLVVASPVPPVIRKKASGAEGGLPEAAAAAVPAIASDKDLVEQARAWLTSREEADAKEDPAAS